MGVNMITEFAILLIANVYAQGTGEIAPGSKVVPKKIEKETETTAEDKASPPPPMPISGMKIFAELYGGLRAGKMTQDYTASGTNNENGTVVSVSAGQIDKGYRGLGVGARLGANLSGFTFGGEIMLSSMNMDHFTMDGNAASDKKYNAGLFSLGGFIGYRAGFGTGLWLGYAPVDSLSIVLKKDERNYTGHSFKFGIGHNFEKWGLALEASKHKFGKKEENNLPYSYTSRGVSITEKEVETKDIMLSIVLPITIRE